MSKLSEREREERRESFLLPFYASYYLPLSLRRPNNKAAEAAAAVVVATAAENERGE